MQEQYDKQLEVIFNLYAQRDKLNRNMQRDRWNINIRIMAETERSRQLDEQINEHHFPIFRNNFILKHNEKTSHLHQ